jgi:hypothetical protein
LLIHEEKKAGFILHPRTASHSTAIALRDIGFVDTGNYHQIDEQWAKHAETVACTVRNPLDVLTSWYFYQSNGRSVSQFLKDWPNQWAQNGMFYGLRYCDYVIEYENLDSELNIWLSQIGLGPVTLGFNNTQQRLPWWVALQGFEAKIKICDRKEHSERFHL